MAQLLIELLSEEIPARMQGQAGRDLERMARERLDAAGLKPSELTTYAGPRRLTLVAEGLPKAQEDRTEERKGPRVGAPDQAIDGFLRSTGLKRDDLVERDGVYFAVTERKGRPTTEIIAAMVEEIVRGFPWPKSMTWGTGKLRWVRPLRRILCVFDRKVVEFSIDGIDSGDLSEGHRFMGTGKPFSARDFDEYHEALSGHFVVLDPMERKTRILAGADKLCAAKGLELVADEGLLDEVAGLAEWPVPVLGDMDPAFLDLPREVIRTSMRTHQKYFAVKTSGKAELAPYFIAVANIEAADGGKAIAAGNGKVLSARLADARFFWDEDRRVKLEDRVKALKGVTFHARLGTMYERTERIEALAREIAPLVDADPNVAAKAARLAKADLTSGMVGEFPELQGLMGGYYAHEEHLPIEIADAICDHYKPQGPNDDTPMAPVSVAVALADKLDTLVGFFAIDEKPTGSKDPYALRRAALGVIRIVLDSDLRITLAGIEEVGPMLTAYGLLSNQVSKRHLENDLWELFRLEKELGVDLGNIGPRDVSPPGGQPFWDRWWTVRAELLSFLADRLKVALRDAGKRHDLVDAVLALGGDDLVRIVARVEALDAFLKTEDGANLLAGYKRAVNILKGDIPEGKAEELKDAPPEETALLKALETVEPKVAAALDKEDFTAAMSELASLRTPVDAFFDKVMVNSDVKAERDNRLKLLGNVRDAMGRVADFSLIAG